MNIVIKDPPPPPTNRLGNVRLDGAFVVPSDYQGEGFVVPAGAHGFVVALAGSCNALRLEGPAHRMSEDGGVAVLVQSAGCMSRLTLTVLPTDLEVEVDVSVTVTFARNR